MVIPADPAFLLALSNGADLLEAGSITSLFLRVPLVLVGVNVESRRALFNDERWKLRRFHD